MRQEMPELLGHRGRDTEVARSNVAGEKPELVGQHGRGEQRGRDTEVGRSNVARERQRYRSCDVWLRYETSGLTVWAFLKNGVLHLQASGANAGGA
jgi:hypothetical protein